MKSTMIILALAFAAMLAVFIYYGIPWYIALILALVGTGLEWLRRQPHRPRR